MKVSSLLPQAFRRRGYLAVSYGKIYHQFLDDAPSWSSQAEFADGHAYRGLRGAAWSRAGTPARRGNPVSRCGGAAACAAPGHARRMV